MFSLALAWSAAGTVVRDSYGVPHVRTDSWADAFYLAGHAVAEDRLWQMEMSRRIARGRMAEVMGREYLASDKEIAQFGYTDDEIRAQINNLSPKGRVAFENYARGVSDYIAEAKAKHALPEGYAKNGFDPEPWTVVDSGAISVRLLQQFGRGGAGEIRNMALLGYLQGQQKVKGHELDVLDDFAWFQDKSAVCTITPDDEALKKPATFLPLPSRADTQRHLALLPKLSLMELLPGIRVAERQATNLVAERLGAPYKVGSYCVLVGSQRSATGKPLLMNGPQMGWQNPSIVHEMSLQGTDFSVTGMDVPGIPGVLVGYTPNLAWGLTSGVADTEDIIYYPTDSDESYRYGKDSRRFETIRRTIKVKGEDPVEVIQRRTTDGPVVLTSKSTGIVFARRSVFYKREIASQNTIYDIVTAGTHAEVDEALKQSTVNFNFFYALKSGDVGYRFMAKMPIRQPGFDPRFPVPGGPETDWKGEVPFDVMPHVINPSTGIVANWNNKPISWWPNGDTPVWGRAFRNLSLLSTIPSRKLTAQDLENSAWTIARNDEFAPYLLNWFQRAANRKPSSLTVGFDGRLLDGSTGAAVYSRFVTNLKQLVFQPTVGSFMTPDNFNQITQVSVLLNALEGKTRTNFLAGRRVDDVLDEAYQKALMDVDQVPPIRYRASAIRVPEEGPIPYSNRGTYLQIIEFFDKGIFGRNVVSPGVAEIGPHSRDQATLAKSWTYKAMGF